MARHSRAAHQRQASMLVGARLSEPHLVSCMAGGGVGMYLFTFGVLPVSIISSETKAAVPPCPLSLIYTAKSERQATTVVARFIRCSVGQVSKKGLKHSNRAQIALARQLGSVCAAVFDCSRSCILAATASARPMLSLHPWCKSGS